MGQTSQVKAWLTGVIGLFSSVLGWAGPLAALYAAAMALDYLTGTAAALKEQRWSPAAARQGIWHKLGSTATVSVAALTDLLLGLLAQKALLPGLAYRALLCPLALAWYIATEFGSILKNAEALGAPVPRFLKNCLKAVQKQTEDEANIKDDEK